MPAHVQQMMKLKKSPLTGNQHILMVMDPYIRQKLVSTSPRGPPEMQLMHMHMGEKVKYYQGYRELQINDKHY